MEPRSLGIIVFGLSFQSERSRSLAEDEGEIILGGFYNFLSPKVAERLEHLVKTTSSLPDQDLSITLILWRQVSRSATLALLDTLLENTRTKVDLTSDLEWVDQCKRALDLYKFKAETSLEEKDIWIALEEAATVFIEYFGMPETPKRFFYKGYLIWNTI